MTAPTSSTAESVDEDSASPSPPLTLRETVLLFRRGGGGAAQSSGGGVAAQIKLTSFSSVKAHQGQWAQQQQHEQPVTLEAAFSRADVVLHIFQSGHSLAVGREGDEHES
jgi:hypothetical protein